MFWWLYVVGVNVYSCLYGVSVCS